VQCHECEGYGHIRTEHATYLKKHKKSLTVSWFDEDDLEREVQNESAKHVTALNDICMSDTESCDEELAASYKDLYTRIE
jgi:Uri superfamily endonuclease